VEALRSSGVGGSFWYTLETSWLRIAIMSFRII
jgi:hypothetical protein